MRRITAWCLSAALLLGGLSGCGTARQSTAQTQAAVSWSDMQPTDSVDLEYAECFSVDHYDMHGFYSSAQQLLFAACTTAGAALFDQHGGGSAETGGELCTGQLVQR